MTSRQLLVRDLLVLFGLAGWALALPYWGSEFVVSLALTCLMYVALSSSWALFCGTTRYLSLATSAFFGIGAYTTPSSRPPASAPPMLPKPPRVITIKAVTV